jgi:hypothetical protein
MANDRNNPEEKNVTSQEIGDKLNQAYEKARESNTDDPPDHTHGGPGPGHRQ